MESPRSAMVTDDFCVARFGVGVCEIGRGPINVVVPNTCGGVVGMGVGVMARTPKDVIGFVWLVSRFGSTPKGVMVSAAKTVVTRREKIFMVSFYDTSKRSGGAIGVMVV